MNDLRELDAALARALGWTERDVPFLLDEDGATLTTERFWLNPSGAYAPLPPFTRTMRATRLLEDEIERRGLEYAYIDVLETIIGADYDEGYGAHSVWKFIRATPEQKARAALATLSAPDRAPPLPPK